ncbi:glycosyltransferase family 1 protein [Novosphingobium sp. MMS21-SN21R]|uniref:glycosyltransferase family 4 protein n=1 Tax=Novosphingobium sp. MMS21-SN21R TaxID=2969298 RepID=UPI0028855442|nr:glycosyltransferase family 1 protein [Novosphingobium sp. MMS21-SN21R]MDT0508281.1 glycosyltransferase family 1 protein [Novosphingobium sp. MMS21-SN21R]
MRIAICTDAWHPQVNGVVRTLAATVDRLIGRGHEVELITPSQFRTMPLPGYSEIRLAMAPRFGTRRTLADFAPDLVHIATEGPIGWSARSWCKANDVPFTSAFHTRFPEYAAARTGLKPERFWPLMRRFHKASRAVLVSTPTMASELAAQGITQTRLWTRGIDRELFRPGQASLPELSDLPGPVLLSVGRVAIEKNLTAFLDTEIEGTKVVVGDGPDLTRLKARYPNVVFMGALHGEALARAYCSADVFVFPSRTDTFGLVMIEALACGVPVAGFPVPGPLDIIGRHGRGPASDLPMQIGALDEDLGLAIAKALRCDRLGAAVHGASFNWERATDQFVAAVGEAVTPVRLHEMA